MSDKKIDDTNLEGVAGAGSLDTHLQVDPNANDLAPSGEDSPEAPGGGSPDPESEGGGGGNQDLQI
jgi:hypothetical protein